MWGAENHTEESKKASTPTGVKIRAKNNIAVILVSYTSAKKTEEEAEAAARGTLSPPLYSVVVLVLCWYLISPYQYIYCTKIVLSNR